MICKKCNKYEITSRSECNVCGFKKRRKEDIDNVLKNELWTIDELETIIYNLLYQKVECINEILPYLNNKTLDDLVVLLGKEMTIRGTTPSKVRISCDMCGENRLMNFSEYLSSNHKYCSKECQNRGATKFGTSRGKNNGKYNSKNIKCTNCGKEFLAPKYIQEQTNSFGDNHTFCCKECYWEYRKKYYVKEKHGLYKTKKTKEQLRKMSIVTTKRITENKFPQTMTKPHIIICDVLSNTNIRYENEYNCKYHSLDIFLESYNLGIEIMGDYWHASPTRYKDKNVLSKIQLKDIKQDKSKHTYVKKYHGFEILYLWEYDINNRMQVCELLINKYIEQNGKLQDYNSFNYYVNGNELLLNQNIVKPYFIN